MRNYEDKIGIRPLEELLAKRAELVGRTADLRARYGPFGTWDALRKIELSKIATLLRAQNLADGVKMTEAAVGDAAHADERYIACVAQATTDRAELALLEDQIQAISDEIQRGNIMARFATAEAHL